MAELRGFWAVLSPYLECFNPYLECFNPFLESLNPYLECFRPFLEYFGPFLEFEGMIFNPFLESFDPYLECFNPFSECFDPFLEFFSPHLESSTLFWSAMRNGQFGLWDVWFVKLSDIGVWIASYSAILKLLSESSKFFLFLAICEIIWVTAKCPYTERELYNAISWENR